MHIAITGLGREAWPGDSGYLLSGGIQNSCPLHCRRNCHPALHIHHSAPQAASTRNWSCPWIDEIVRTGCDWIEGHPQFPTYPDTRIPLKA